MDEKRNALLTVGLVCAVLFVLGVADLCNSDRVYSESENRVLASRPVFPGKVSSPGNTGMLMKNICPISSPVGINGWELRLARIFCSGKGDQRRISGIGSLPDRGKRSGGIHTADGGFPHRFPEKAGKPVGCQSHAGTYGG